MTAKQQPANFSDLTGIVFGRWTVLRRGGREEGPKGGSLWCCRCICGTERVVKASSLRSGRSQSCGCLHKEVVASVGRSRKTHGRTGTKEYRAWNQMIQRCHNPDNHTHKRYGVKGVTVCERWRSNFADFLADMGDSPTPDHSLDRIDPFGNYEPGNCRWATREQQRLNQRRTKRFLYQGELLALPELAEKTGIKAATLRARLVNLKWDVERATATDPNAYHNR